MSELDLEASRKPPGTVPILRQGTVPNLRRPRSKLGLSPSAPRDESGLSPSPGQFSDSLVPRRAFLGASAGLALAPLVAGAAQLPNPPVRVGVIGSARGDRI